MKSLKEFLEKIVAEGAGELCKKTSCSQCTHWNDGYGNDDICECLGCPQNCDNYTMAD